MPFVLPLASQILTDMPDDAVKATEARKLVFQRLTCLLIAPTSNTFDHSVLRAK